MFRPPQPSPHGARRAPPPRARQRQAGGEGHQGDGARRFGRGRMAPSTSLLLRPAAFPLQWHFSGSSFHSAAEWFRGGNGYRAIQQLQSKLIDSGGSPGEGEVEGVLRRITLGRECLNSNAAWRHLYVSVTGANARSYGPIMQDACILVLHVETDRSAISF